jgi:hypothetical protein
MIGPLVNDEVERVTLFWGSVSRIPRGTEENRENPRISGVPAEIRIGTLPEYKSSGGVPSPFLSKVRQLLCAGSRAARVRISNNLLYNSIVYTWFPSVAVGRTQGLAGRGLVVPCVEPLATPARWVV